jgi:hypothetical protein
MERLRMYNEIRNIIPKENLPAIIKFVNNLDLDFIPEFRVRDYTLEIIKPNPGGGFGSVYAWCYL